MSDLKTRLYAKATGRVLSADADVAASWMDLIGFLWVRGGLSRLKGWWVRWRLGACGGRLLVGRRTQLRFPNHLHVGRNVSIGHDSYVNALAQRGIRLGDHVRIREYAWIQATSALDQPGVGLVVGQGTYIGPRCLFGAGGGITIGQRVTFGASVHLLAENHEFRDASRWIQDQGVTRKGIAVEDDVWIGNHVVVLDGVRIGRGAVIGAGAIVTKDVPAMAIAVGNPARVVGQRS